MTAPEVEAAARRESVVDAPPIAPETKRRRPGRPKKEAPPASAAGGTKPPGRPAGAVRKTPLAPKLQELFSAGGAVALIAGMARGDERLVYDGQRIVEGSERLALALDKAALESPALRRALELLVTTSAWGELAMAAGAIMLPILANHGALPEMAATLVGAPMPPARPESPPAAGNGAAGVWNPLDLADFVTPASSDGEPGTAP